MFARKFSSDGRMRWPAPCRARNATRFPRSVAITYGPDGSPNGVAMVRSSRSVSSAMSYSPLPPMIPIVGCLVAIDALLQLDEHAAGARGVHERDERVLRARPRLLVDQAD